MWGYHPFTEEFSTQESHENTKVVYSMLQEGEEKATQRKTPLLMRVALLIVAVVVVITVAIYLSMADIVSLCLTSLRGSSSVSAGQVLVKMFSNIFLFMNYYDSN